MTATLPPVPPSTSIEFDDIVYSLQSFGGISEYWREVTTRIEGMVDFQVQRRPGSAWGRTRRLRSTARIFHSSYFRTARSPETRTVTTVHDLAYELGHGASWAKSWLHRVEHRRAYFASDALICVSNSTRADLLSVYPELASRCPVFVVPHGVNFGRDSIAGVSSTPAPIESPYVLYVGGRNAYKNFDNALLGFAESGLERQGLMLVCTGDPFLARELRRIAQLGLRDAVRSLGKVDRPMLAKLYAHAHCLLYPSRFEGFGMPLLEAMRIGCPVIASNCSVMPEIAADAGLLVDTLDPAAIATALNKAGQVDVRRHAIQSGLLRAEEFSWDRSAADHAKVYCSLS